MAINTERAQEIFLAVLDQPNSDRNQLLDRECQNNSELKKRVEALLAAHDESGSFLAQPVVRNLDETIDSEPFDDSSAPTGEYSAKNEGSSDHFDNSDFGNAPKSGLVIAGRYVLQELIGQGGMGEVWVAKQTEPVKRLVALKLIKSGMDSKAVLSRFEQERQALAMMDHPNIARVLDGGMTPSGHPFFVMELVNGLPLTKFCDESRLTPKERLELFVSICQAVQHAHQKGIVHRDLKPANILVTLIDAKPVPKVIDFGVAKATAEKLTDESMFTQFGAIVGTLEYMSPEQASFSGMDIDTRTDLYSLGVILYELLTGLRPIDSSRLKKVALNEMIRIIQEEEPSKPSTRLSSDASLPSLAALRHTDPKKLMALLRGELDWIVLKCLEKQRDRRYETVNALSRDIQRFLADEPVEARPPNVSYRFGKFLKRNKGQVIAASLLFVALVGGIIGTSIGLIRADSALGREIKERAKAEGLAEKNANLAVSETIAKNKEKSERKKAEELAKKNAKLAESETIAKNDYRYQLSVSNELLARTSYENHNVRLASESLLKVPEENRKWDWRYLSRQTQGGIFTISGHEVVTSVAYCPDGSIIATAGGDRVKLWNARTGELLREQKLELGRNSPQVPGRGYLPVQHKTLNQRGKIITNQFVAFSPDGKHLLTGGGGVSPTVWLAKTGEEVFKLSDWDSNNVFYSPDGSHIFTQSKGGAQKLWDANNGQLTHTLQKNGPSARWTTFSPDNTRIVSSTFGGMKLEVRDMKNTNEISHTWSVRPSVGIAICYSPDGTRIAGTKSVIDAKTGNVLFELTDQNIQTLAFSPDGMRIATGCTDGLVKVWDTPTGRLLNTFVGHTGEILCVVFSPDCQQIVSGAADGKAKVWDAQNGTPHLELQSEQSGTLGLAFNRIANGENPTKVVSEIRNLKVPSQSERQNILAMNRDGTRLLASGDVFDEKQRRFVPSPVRVIDTLTGKDLFSLEGLQQTVSCAAFSLDGTRIVTGARGTNSPSNGLVQVWDGQTGKLKLIVKGEMTHVSSVAFSSDGKKIIAGNGYIGGSWPTFGIPGEAKVWDSQTGETLAVLVRSLPKENDPSRPNIGRKDAWTRLPVLSVAFSPDDKQIVTGHMDLMGINGETNVWDAKTYEKQFSLQGHRKHVFGVAFNSDGTRIVTASMDGTAKVWDARTGTELVELIGHGGGLSRAAFSRDNNWIVTIGFGKLVAWGTGTGKELPDTEEIAERREFTRPNLSRYRQAHEFAKTSRNDFASRFYEELIQKNGGNAK